MSILDRRTFLAAAGASAAVPSVACAQEPAESWNARASLPWPVQEIYAAVHQGRIVTGGGLVARAGQPLHIEDRVGLYDPATDAWSELPKLPSPRHHPMVFASDGELFVFGGYGRSAAGEWTSMRDCWVLSEGAWVETIPLDAPQSEAVGVSHDGLLHLITGRTPGGLGNGNWNDQVDTDAHRVYITGADAWDTARPCPMARNSAAAAVMDGAIWVAGGRTVSGGGTGRLDRYDPAEDRWDTLAPIPPSPETGQQVGGGLAMAAISGRLVAFGGEWFQRGGGGGVFRETWIYTAADDAWRRGPDMATPRHGLAAAAIDNTVYAIAGGEVVSGGRAGNVVEACEFSLFY
ncbi:Kelch repeat-containing protein [Brevundimonas sp.]|uniref:Kelch repeat-containing protein n=1 Tax=Brevundimonas sp. TaxID=1871086 RepID=UPI002D3F8C8F|nr:kelch repeat-containing protein [Brevundimonas sp.]HYD26128.1 kelch repeat-containing protein [Brevundimonas sp.]